MNFGRKIVMLILQVVALQSTCEAQVRTEPVVKSSRSVEEDKAREQTRWMFRNLSLKPDQYEKVNEINLTYAFKCDSIDHLKNKSLRTEARSRVKEDREAHIKAVLTTEQYKLYVAHKEQQLTQSKSPFSGSYIEH